MRRLQPLSLLFLLLLLAPAEAAEIRLDNLVVEVKFTPQARCWVEASAYGEGVGPLPPLELGLRVSRSGPSSVKMEVEGRVGDLGWLENFVSQVKVQQLNLLLSYYHGKRLGELARGGDLVEVPEVRLPPEWENLVVERIEVKEFEPLHPGLRFSLLVVLGWVPGGWEYLPLGLRLSLSPSGEVVSLRAWAELGLPQEGDRVVVDFSHLFDLENLLQGVSVGSFSLILQLPEGASVSGLRGFENENGSYSFSGEDSESFRALLSSLGETSLSYPYSPPAPSLFTVLVAVSVLPLLGGVLWLLRGKALSRKKKVRG